MVKYTIHFDFVGVLEKSRQMHSIYGTIWNTAGKIFDINLTILGVKEKVRS
jgi:hypothetical protein